VEAEAEAVVDHHVKPITITIKNSKESCQRAIYVIDVALEVGLFSFQIHSNQSVTFLQDIGYTTALQIATPTLIRNEFVERREYQEVCLKLWISRWKEADLLLKESWSLRMEAT
jgi:hypothetical protein